jgi:Ca2+/Na+ antiporter
MLRNLITFFEIFHQIKLHDVLHHQFLLFQLYHWNFPQLISLPILGIVVNSNMEHCLIYIYYIYIINSSWLLPKESEQTNTKQKRKWSINSTTATSISHKNAIVRYGEKSVGLAQPFFVLFIGLLTITGTINLFTSTLINLWCFRMFIQCALF